MIILTEGCSALRDPFWDLRVVRCDIDYAWRWERKCICWLHAFFVSEIFIFLRLVCVVLQIATAVFVVVSSLLFVDFLAFLIAYLELVKFCSGYFQEVSITHLIL